MDTKDEDDEDELRRTSVHDHGELTYLLRGTHCMNAEHRPCSEIEETMLEEMNDGSGMLEVLGPVPLPIPLSKI